MESAEPRLGRRDAGPRSAAPVPAPATAGKVLGVLLPEQPVSQDRGERDADGGPLVCALDPLVGAACRPGRRYATEPTRKAKKMHNSLEADSSSLNRYRSIERMSTEMPHATRKNCTTGRENDCAVPTRAQLLARVGPAAARDVKEVTIVCILVLNREPPAAT